jgi:hypothetical protein
VLHDADVYRIASVALNISVVSVTPDAYTIALVSWVWVILNPLGTSATIWHNVPVPGEG